MNAHVLVIRITSFITEANIHLIDANEKAYLVIQLY